LSIFWQGGKTNLGSRASKRAFFATFGAIPIPSTLLNTRGHPQKKWRKMEKRLD